MTSPVAVPVEKFMSFSKFDLVQVTSGNVLRSGAGFTTSIAPAYWQVEGLSTPVLSRADKQALDAFFAKLGGGQVAALLYDPEKAFPLAYAETGWTGLTVAGGSDPFDGTANLYAITDVNTVTVNSLPASFELTEGDHIGFVKSGRYSLHLITDTVTGETGGNVDLSVSPPVPSYITAGADAVFEKPRGEFIVSTGSISRARGVNPQPVSFSARSRAN